MNSRDHEVLEARVAELEARLCAEGIAAADEPCPHWQGGRDIKTYSHARLENLGRVVNNLPNL
jgi:hypothetical protein